MSRRRCISFVLATCLPWFAQTVTADTPAPASQVHANPVQDTRDISPFLRAVVDHDGAKFRSLLHQGASFDFHGSDGATAIFTATENKDDDILGLLLAHSTPVDPIDSDGNTPLIDIPLSSADASSLMPDELRSQDRQNAACATLLCQHGAKVDAHGDFGFTALHWAAQCAQPITTRVLLRWHADPNSRDQNGATPLMAALNNQTLSPGDSIFREVRVLLAHGAKINAVDKNGDTVLHNMFSGTTWDADGPPLVKVVGFLLSHGANANAKNNRGVTPLMIAAQSARVDIVKILLAHRAQINARDKSGRSVLGYTGRWQGPPTHITTTPGPPGFPVSEAVVTTSVELVGASPAENARFQKSLEQSVSKRNPVTPLLVRAGAKW